MRTRLLLLASVLTVSITACSSSGTTTPGTGGSIPLNAIESGPSSTQGVAPNALSRKLMREMPPLRAERYVPDPTPKNSVRDETPQLNLRNFRRQKPLSTNGNDTHFWEGVFSQAYGHESGIKSIMSVYKNYSVPGGYTDYAPDMNSTGGGCLEMLVAYNNSAPAAAFNVFDWCDASPGFVVSKAITDAFVDAYVSNVGGIPSVHAATLTFNTSSPYTWHAELYNNTTGKWDILYDQKGKPNGTTGFSYFEQYAPVDGNCPAVPTIASQDIEAYDAGSASYVKLTPSNSFINKEAACFTSKPNPYVFTLLEQNYAWEVTGGDAPSN